VEADPLADGPEQIGEFDVANVDVEGPGGAAAGHGAIGHGTLQRRHFVIDQAREAVAPENHFLAAGHGRGFEHDR
jgi:hypothetical protein